MTTSNEKYQEDQVVMNEKPYLVYTSAGDNTNLKRWVEAGRDFDLWVTYYGDKSNDYDQLADFYYERKGSKWGNLHYTFQNFSARLAQYRAIFVLDDDIVLTCDEINRLFQLLDEHDLWALQPAFDPVGKISHPITLWDPESKLRFVNYIENGVIMARMDKMAAFMNEYDPKCMGWGVDDWFLSTLGDDVEGRVAIVDEITCINPMDFEKADGREWYKLPNSKKEEEIRIWREIVDKYDIDGISPSDHTVYRRIPRTGFGKLLNQVGFRWRWGLARLYKGIGTRIWQPNPDKND